MIPTQPFGHTGHESTRLIFGAFALATVTQDEADRTMEHRPTVPRSGSRRRSPAVRAWQVFVADPRARRRV